MSKYPWATIREIAYAYTELLDETRCPGQSWTEVFDDWDYEVEDYFPAAWNAIIEDIEKNGLYNVREGLTTWMIGYDPDDWICRKTAALLAWVQELDNYHVFEEEVIF